MNIVSINNEGNSISILEVGEYPLQRVQAGGVITESQYIGSSSRWVVYRGPDGKIVDGAQKLRKRFLQAGNSAKPTIMEAVILTFQLGFSAFREPEELRLGSADWAIVYRHDMASGDRWIEKIVMWSPFDYDSLCDYLANWKYRHDAKQDYLLARASFYAAVAWTESQFQIRKKLVGKYRTKGISRRGLFIRWQVKEKNLAERAQNQLIEVKAPTDYGWYNPLATDVSGQAKWRYPLLVELLRIHGEELRSYLYDDAPEPETPPSAYQNFSGYTIIHES